jgi:hypothetical protein
VRAKKYGGRLNFRKLTSFITEHMTALEAIAAVGIGMIAGVKLPAMAENAISKLSGRSVNLTSGWRGPVAGAVLSAGLAGLLYQMKFLNYGTASTLAVAGVTVGALNLLNQQFNLPLPGVALIEGGPRGLFGSMHNGQGDSVIDEPLFGSMHNVNPLPQAFGGAREINLF